MTRRAHCSVLLVALVLLPWPFAGWAQTLSPASAPNWQQQLDAWRAAQASALDAPDGWLTLIAIEWLKPGINSIGAAPGNSIRIHAQAPDSIGLLTVSGKTVQLRAPAGGFPAGLMLSGQPAREGSLTISDRNPSIFTWHGLSMVVLQRDDRYVLRIKDADAPTRTAFRGLHWYPPDPRLVINARWIPYNTPRVEKIPTVLGTTLDLPALGLAEFSLEGQTLQLEPVIEGGDTTKLFFILSDQTSKTTTYEGGRFLSTGLPNHGLTHPGNLVLDFNRLVNPPCAYTVYATCPLPPQQNRLPVALPAGQLRYTP